MAAVEDASSLRHLTLFSDLPLEKLERLNGLLHRTSFAQGAVILAAEQPGEAIYVILDGTVKIFVGRPDGSETILALLGPGDTVGEMSLVDSVGHSASVIALERSTLLWLDRRHFHECIETMPELSRNLVRLLSARLRLANELILALSGLDVAGRVARQLLAFAERYGRAGEDGSVTIPLKVTQSDLAALVGASRERVNRVVVSLKRQGTISVRRNRHIVLHDRTMLAERCR